jgi:hypothetical protein
MQKPSPSSPANPTALTCTVDPGEQVCLDTGVDSVFANQTLTAIRVESSGAGLNATDDAYIGIAAQTTPTIP